MNDPVVQIIDEATGEIVYTLRIKGTSFRPRVFKPGKYTVRVGDQDKNNMKTFKGVASLAKGKAGNLRVKF